MKEKLIYDINQYIGYLNNIGLFITVHGKGISGLLEHNIHRHPFCSLVKTDSNAWDKCILSQQKIFKQYRLDFLFGMCHVGMEEFVFFANEKTFVSVSGYGINKKSEKAYKPFVAGIFLINQSYCKYTKLLLNIKQRINIAYGHSQNRKCSVQFAVSLCTV